MHAPEIGTKCISATTNNNSRFRNRKRNRSLYSTVPVTARRCGGHLPFRCSSPASPLQGSSAKERDTHCVCEGQRACRCDRALPVLSASPRPSDDATPHHAYTPFAHSRHLCGRNQHIDAVHSLPFSRRQRATLASVSALSAHIHLCFASPALRTFLMPFFPLPHATTPCAASVCAPQKRTDHGRKFDRDWFNSLRRCINSVQSQSVGINVPISRDAVAAVVCHLRSSRFPRAQGARRCRFLSRHRTRGGAWVVGSIGRCHPLRPAQGWDRRLHGKADVLRASESRASHAWGV